MSPHGDQPVGGETATATAETPARAPPPGVAAAQATAVGPPGMAGAPAAPPNLPARVPVNPPEAVPQAEAAWEWFRAMGSPKTWVAPMVDGSELPFRQLCRRYGAQGAYSPMLHARLFSESPGEGGELRGYAGEHYTTCPEDRPLLAQFCANDPSLFVAAARRVQASCDGVDLNFGCPQRIAKKGRYGAYLSDEPELCEALVRAGTAELDVPVTVKIRRQATVEQTVAFAARLERAGAFVVAVHGRTRDQRTAKLAAPEMHHVAAVKAALRVPVLANGDIREAGDVDRVLAETGCDGVLSAETLLEDPAVFARAGFRAADAGGDAEGLGEVSGSVGPRAAAAATADDDGGSVPEPPAKRQAVDGATGDDAANPAAFAPAGASRGPLDAPGARSAVAPTGPAAGADLLLEYCELCRAHPVPLRMMKMHAFRMVGPWLSEFVDIRERLNRGPWDVEGLHEIASELRDAILATGRDRPAPRLSEKKLAQMAKEQAVKDAIASQKAEDDAVAEADRRAGASDASPPAASEAVSAAAC